VKAGRVLRVVVYGVKSSPDEKGAVADQHRQIIEAIEREGDREVIGTFGEENESGYRKSRGPELERAMQTAIDAATADGEAELWVWHSSRLARGTGKKGEAQSLMERLTYLRRNGVTVRAVDRGDMIANPLLWGIEDEQQSAYSQNLGTWVKAGIARRKAAGKPIGPVPLGYVVENALDHDGQPVVGRANRIVTRRVVDSRLSPIVVQAFEQVAEGKSPGSVARWLNAQGIVTRRGKPHTAVGVRHIIRNDIYAGARGYPQLVHPELAAAARKALRRADPVAVQARKGGRCQQDPAFILRSIAFCLKCGAPMYSTKKYRRGERSYVCANKVKATGLCDSPPVPAQAAERHAIRHLHTFIGSVEEWIGGQLAERNHARQEREKLLDEQRAGLGKLKAKRDKRMAELEDVGISKVGLEVIERIDREIAAQDTQVAAAEVLLEEWNQTPDVDDALDFYSELLDILQGRIRNAPKQDDLNEALAGVLAGIWCKLDGARLVAEFALRDDFGDEREPLPPARISIYQPREPSIPTSRGQ
jgi:DNA invertase Pin-like site-specific DNA recombinase